MIELEIIKYRFVHIFVEIKACFVCGCCFYPLDMEHNNPAYTISAALCYATQLVNILSHILDINLPKKLCNRQVIEGSAVLSVTDLLCSYCVLIHSN